MANVANNAVFRRVEIENLREDVGGLLLQVAERFHDVEFIFFCMELSCTNYVS
jgi:hypothetical protein